MSHIGVPAFDTQLTTGLQCLGNTDPRRQHSSSPLQLHPCHCGHFMSEPPRWGICASVPVMQINSLSVEFFVLMSQVLLVANQDFLSYWEKKILPVLQLPTMVSFPPPVLLGDKDTRRTPGTDASSLRSLPHHDNTKLSPPPHQM